MRADAEVSRTRLHHGNETERFRQALFLKFLRNHCVHPSQWLGDGRLFRKLVGLYTVDLIDGNTITRDILRAQTIREHLEAVNHLFIQHGYTPPVDFDDPTCHASLFYNNVKT